MTIVTTILLVLASIIALLLLVAFFTKRECIVEKSVVINKPKQEVFDYMKLIRNQEYYSVWVMKDPNIKLTYTGIDGAVGFIAAWESNDKNVGVGAQEIVGITNGESIKMELRFKKPFEATNYATNTITAVGSGQTKVTTIFTGKSKFPMNIMNLFMDKLIGRDMQKNLENMKANIEKN
ncbi:MAG: SRPBCC family protein [Bacteroidota bacterium]